MHSFNAELIPGTQAPYDTWTFVVVPSDIFDQLGKAKPPVRGTIGGVGFRETINRSGGVPRMLVRRDLLEKLGAALGDVVEVRLELDPEPRTFEIPAELQALFDGESELAACFAGLPPSLRRAWAAHIAEAKRPETRLRRAEKARTGIPKKLYPNQLK